MCNSSYYGLPGRIDAIETAARDCCMDMAGPGHCPHLVDSLIGGHSSSGLSSELLYHLAQAGMSIPYRGPTRDP